VYTGAALAKPEYLYSLFHDRQTPLCAAKDAGRV